MNGFRADAEDFGPGAAEGGLECLWDIGNGGVGDVVGELVSGIRGAHGCGVC